MIDTVKILSDVDLGQLPYWKTTIRELCDEVDRISKLHGEAHNARVAVENQNSQLRKEIIQYEKEVTRKVEHIQVLLDALAARKREKR